MMIQYDKIIFIFFFPFIHGADEGEECHKGNFVGKCINIRNCPSAIEGIQNKQKPQICSFRGRDPIVCCVEKNPTTLPYTSETRSTQRTTIRTTTTTEDQYEGDDDRIADQGYCEPIARNLTSEKTGQKAWDQCIEYQEKYVYPCEKSVAFTGELTRVKHCKHNIADELVVGGVDAGQGEFPHMVLLGFGKSADIARWDCGGTIISEWFIMTAGHCTFSKDFSPVTYAIIGTQKRSEEIDPSNLYKISEIIKHPYYRSPIKYNDLALLKTAREMELNQFALPACLHVGPVDERKASASGWGALDYRAGNADLLQKVTLAKFNDDECFATFPKSRHMPDGFDANTQICYGDHNTSRDTCQGDSGGPLQVKSKDISCMYVVIGVTSLGKTCGLVGVPAIYTKVITYVPWIESIVWA